MPRRFGSLARRWRRCGRHLRCWMRLKGCENQSAEFGIRSAISLLTGRAVRPQLYPKDDTWGLEECPRGRFACRRVVASTVAVNYERKYERSEHRDTQRAFGQ